MIVEKTKKTTVMIDAKLLGSSDLDGLIVQLYNDSWAGRAADGGIILKALSIMKRGPVYFRTNDVFGRGYVDCVMNIEFLFYETGELVIPKVQTITEREIILHDKHLICWLEVSKETGHLKEGDTAPLVIVKTLVTSRQKNIGALVPLFDTREHFSYTVEDGFAHLPEFISVIERIESLEAHWSNINADTKKQVIKLLNIDKDSSAVASIRGILSPEPRTISRGTNLIYTGSVVHTKAKGRVLPFEEARRACYNIAITVLVERQNMLVLAEAPNLDDRMYQDITKKIKAIR